MAGGRQLGTRTYATGFLILGNIVAAQHPSLCWGVLTRSGGIHRHHGCRVTGYGGRSMLPNFKKSESKLNGASATPPQSFATSPSDRTISILGPDLTVNGDLIS